MNNKVIAIGVVAILLAVTLVGAAQVINKDDDKNEEAKLEGNWTLAYIEKVYLVDDAGNPIYDVEKCHVTEHYLNTITNVHTLNIECTGTNFFKGSFDGKEEIMGSFNGLFLTCQDVVSGSDPHMFHMHGNLKGDQLSLTSLRYDFTDPEKISSVSYLLFFREGSKPMSPMVDYINYDIDYTHVFSQKHRISDFTVDKDGKGESIDRTLRYSSTHSMISLFEILDESDNVIGIQVLSSLGTSLSGAAISIVAGNVKDGTENRAFIGNASMAHGKFYVSHFVEGDGDPGYVEYQYNVPYEDGRTFPVMALYEKYEGTVSVWSKDKKEVHNIVKAVSQNGRTIYAVDEMNGVVYQWFGEVAGPIFNVFITTPDGFGRFSGEIAKGGTIIMSGTVLLKTGAVTAYSFELHPVKG